MLSALVFVVTTSSLFAGHAATQAVNRKLVGTWSSKSGKVLTGPNFYNPIAETINEPALTGISYSFTANGYYEEALFRAIPNPVDPSCPGAVIQWQHGSFVQAENSSLQLTPIAVDGRQLMSQPCQFSNSLFRRYEQKEVFTKAEVETDGYNGRLRLNLFAWDGTPLNPMWLVYTEPEMLPTTTLNPTISASATSATATTKARYRSKRAEEIKQETGDGKTLKTASKQKLSTRDRCFWIGVGLVGLGSVMFCSV